jgi:hypothetical protein
VDCNNAFEIVGEGTRRNRLTAPAVGTVGRRGGLRRDNVQHCRVVKVVEHNRLRVIGVGPAAADRRTLTQLVDDDARRRVDDKLPAAVVCALSVDGKLAGVGLL